MGSSQMHSTSGIIQQQQKEDCTFSQNSFSSPVSYVPKKKQNPSKCAMIIVLFFVFLIFSGWLSEFGDIVEIVSHSCNLRSLSLKVIAYYCLIFVNVFFLHCSLWCLMLKLHLTSAENGLCWVKAELFPHLFDALHVCVLHMDDGFLLQSCMKCLWTVVLRAEDGGLCTHTF